MILIKSMIMAAIICALLRPFCYLMCGVVMAIDSAITKISNTRIWLIFKLPLYLVLYPPFYVLGILMIVLSYLMGYNLLDESIDSL